MTNIPLPRPTEAQYVKIQSKDLDPTYLHLCEVEVYGDFVRDGEYIANTSSYDFLRSMPWYPRSFPVLSLNRGQGTILY